MVKFLLGKSQQQKQSLQKKMFYLVKFSAQAKLKHLARIVFKLILIPSFHVNADPEFGNGSNDDLDFNS